MKYFQYLIMDDEIAESKGEISSVPPGFIEYNATLTGLGVYYKLVGTKISEVIGEAIHEDAARRRVEESL